jgi:hypothetical protein
MIVVEELALLAGRAPISNGANPITKLEFNTLSWERLPLADSANKLLTASART